MQKNILNFFLFFVLMLVTGVASAATPVFTYTPSASYPIGTGMSLSPAVTTAPAGLTFATPGTAYTTTGLKSPYGMAFDSNGDLYVANYTSGKVTEYGPTGTYLGVVITTGATNSLDAIAIDASNNIYLGTQGGTIFKYNSAFTAQTLTLSTTPTSIYGLTVDAAGNIYVADASKGWVDKYNSAGTLQFALKYNSGAANGLIYDPAGVQVDASGNIYVLDYNYRDVVEFSSAGVYVATPVPVNTLTATGPLGFYMDGGGNFYIANSSGGNIKVYSGAGALITTVTPTSGTDPQGVVVDKNGNLYEDDYTGNVLYKYAPTGGYAITSGTLPAGLTFSPTTGIISGTPTVAGNYPLTVTGYGSPANGTSSFTIVCAPTIAYTGSPFSYTVGTAITSLTPTVTGSPTVYSISPNLTTNTGLTFSTTTGVISGTPTLVSAAVTYTITATANGASGTTTISIATSPAKPTIAYTGSPFIYGVGVPITTLIPTTTNTPTSFTISPNLNTNTGLTFDPTTGIISGTPTTASAAVTYTISAYNTNPTPGTTTISIAVVALPIISYTTPDYFTAGTAITSQSPTNTGGTPTSYAVFGPALPAGLSLNTSTGVITGTPTTAQTAANYQITATNAAGTTAPFTISITVYPKVPTVAYTGSPFTYGVGVAITTLTPVTTNSPTSFTINPSLNTNTGLTFNTSTGVISGTPTTASAAVTYTINAYNANPTAGTTSISITVVALPVISYTTPLYFTQGILIASQGPTNTGGTPTSYAVSGTALPAGLALNTSTGVISGTPTTAQTAANYQITATNAAGTTAPFTVNITVYPPPPTISYAGTPYTFGNGVTITSQTPTVTGSPTSFTISPSLNTNTGLTFDPTTGIISGTPTTVSAAVTYTISAYNINPNPGTTTISVTVVNVPVISYTTPDTYTVAVAITALTPTNTGGAAVSYAVSGTALPAGLSLNTATGVISGTPTAAAASANYMIVATNAAGNSAPFSINITVNNPPIPVITYTTPDTYIVGALVSLSPTNTGGTAVSYSAPSLPAGLTINTTTGVISGTVTTVTAAANYPVTATNAGGASVAFNVNITVNPKAPVITYTTPNVWLVGTFYSLSPTNTGGAATYNYAGTFPAGITMDPATGIISGTPTAAYATATITITASNVTGSSSKGVSITVNQPTPVLSYTTPDTYYVGTVVTLNPTNSQAAVTTSYAITGTLPAGLTLNTTSGVISGTVTTITSASTVTIYAYTGTSSGSTTVTINVTAVPPSISYSPSTNTYTVGTTITNLTPTNTGGAVPTGGFGPGVAITSTTFSEPDGMAFDASGNLYVTQNNAKTKELSSTLSYTGTFGGRQSTPVGIVFDSSGNAYILDYGNSKVYEYNSSGTLITTITPRPGGASFTNPVAIAIDGSNNLYVADNGTNYITKFNTAGTPIQSFSTNVTQPTNVAVDASGNVYVLNDGTTAATRSVTRYNSNGIYQSTLVTGLSQPTGLAVDDDGNIYVGDNGSGKVTEYNPSGVILATVNVSGDPEGIVVDKSGNLYVADNINNTVTKYPTAGGYTVNAPLPPGLSFDSTTGTFSGMPTAAFSAYTYTVSCTNTGGTVSTTVTISCIITPPNISYTPSVNVYPVNQPIATLTPVNTGAPVSPINFGTGTPLTGGTISGPSGMNFDASGNLYVTNFNNNTISEFNSSGTYLGTFGSATPAMTAPIAIDFDSSGNAYVLNTGTISGTSFIYKYNSAGVYQSTIETNITHALGMAIDASNNLYVASSSGNQILKYATSGGPASLTINTGTNSNPSDVTVDAAGNIYVLNYTSGTVVKYSSTGTNLGTIITGLSNPYNIHIDVNNNLYVCNSDGSTVNVYTTGGTAITTFNVTDPEGDAIDASGNLYVSDYTDNVVYKYLDQGGYSINAPLPPGMSFSSATGAISGTPTSVWPTTVYTVTAHGYGATATTTVTITCVITYDWIGAVSSDWNTPGNWESNSVPTSINTANIGVNYAFNYPPVVSSTGPTAVSIASILLGNQGGKASGVSVANGYTLNVTGSITKQSDANSTLGYVSYLSGAGTINAANVTVRSTTTAASAYTESISSSVNSMVLSGTVTLTSTTANSAFYVTGGTTKVTGALTSSNAAAYNSTFSVIPTSPATATLQLSNTTALSGLSTTGTNTVSFLNPGATVEYSGAAQTVYTDATVSGLTGGISYQNIKFSGTGIKTPAGTSTNNLNIGGDFTNALTLNDATDYVSLTSTIVNFTGSTENIYAGNGTGTTFNKINFSGTGTTTIQSGMAYVQSTGILTMSNSAVLAAGGFLTLNSDINGSAIVPSIPSGCSITGNVNVQRYLSGGQAYDRGYRLLTSTVSTGGIYSINYLINSCYLTGTTGTAGGFDKAGNPTLYLYRENLAPSNAQFTSGNYRGINTIYTAPNYSYLIDGDAGTYNIPTGDGYLFFFRGDRSKGTLAAETTPGYTPQATTLTATGTLNQGSINVSDWYTPSSPYLGFTNTAGNSSIQGFNLVGNPYPSSINWDLYQTTSNSSGIYAPGTTGFIYIIDPKSHNYNVYQAGMGGVGTIASSGSNIIAEGQGFFVRALNNSAQVTFNESAKISTQVVNGVNLFMGAPPVSQVSQYLHLKMIQDTINTDGIIVAFNSSAQPQFSSNIDAAYKNGTGSVSLSSFSADSVQLAFNTLALPKLTPDVIKLDVKAATDGVYQLNMESIKSIPALYDIWLMDAFNKDSLDMRANQTYNFDFVAANTATWGPNRFTLVIRENPALMVHLLNFTATKITGGSNVVWTTENEQNYTNFTVERSTDGGVTYNVLDGVPSSGQGTYSYLDQAPVPGADSYRLKIVDLNGTISYSNVVTIQYANTGNTLVGNGLIIYPNPSRATLNVKIPQGVGSVAPGATLTSTVYSIQIINNLGSVIQTATTTSQTWQTDVSNLTPGTYILVVTKADNSIVGKGSFVKL